MALAYIASLDLMAICPSVALSIGVPAIAIQAELSGALALNASLTVSPPTIAVYLAALEQLQVALAAGISLNVSACSWGVDVNAGIAVNAALIVKLEAAFSLLVTLEGLLSASIGMYAFTYSGTASAMGAAVTSQLATQWPDGVPTSGTSNALIFGAVTPIAQTQFMAFLNGLRVGAGLIYTAKMSALAQLSLVTSAATAQGNAAIQAQLNTALAIDAALKARINLPLPTLQVTAVALAKFAASLTAQIGLAPPSIKAALSATANLAASISSQFNLIVSLGITLNRFDAQAFCYTWSGAGNALGAALTTALASTWGDGVTPTSGACVAAILATTDSFTYSTMLGFFGGV